jgi:daunorubicin/doxorubicin transport system ATP-binding protein
LSDYPAIEAADLRKVFGTRRAVDGLDLEIDAGTVFALVGAAGAGKTTTIRMLSALLRPDFGRAWVFGHDVVAEAAAVRSRIGLAGRSAVMDENLPGCEILRLTGRLRGLSEPAARSRADELLAAFALTGAAGRPVRTYSSGMRRRLDSAARVIIAPDLLLLDEPAHGLGPCGRGQVWNIIRAVAADGGTVLLTTRHHDEADRLADQIAVLDHGRITAPRDRTAGGSGIDAVLVASAVRPMSE